MLLGNCDSNLECQNAIATNLHTSICFTQVVPTMRQGVYVHPDTHVPRQYIAYPRKYSQYETFSYSFNISSFQHFIISFNIDREQSLPFKASVSGDY